MNEFEDEDTVDLRAYQVLGGVLNFDLLALPPQPKQVKGWIMTQGIKRLFVTFIRFFSLVRFVLSVREL